MHFQFLIVDPGCYDLVENLSIETNTRSMSMNVGSSGLTYWFCLFTFLIISSWNTASFSLNLNKSIDLINYFCLSINQSEETPMRTSGLATNVKISSLILKMNVMSLLLDMLKDFDCLTAFCSRHRSKFAALHRQLWRLHMSEKVLLYEERLSIY